MTNDAEPEYHVPVGYCGLIRLFACEKCGLKAWKTVLSDAVLHQPYDGGCRGRWMPLKAWNHDNPHGR